MASRRAPIRRSLSQGEVRVVKHTLDTQAARFCQNQPATLKKLKREKQNRSSIFTIEPENETKKNPDKVGFCAFLEACLLCKKQLKGLDAYMYSYLGAHCSEDCREHSMALDGFEQKFWKEYYATKNM